MAQVLLQVQAYSGGAEVIKQFLSTRQLATMSCFTWVQKRSVKRPTQPDQEQLLRNGGRCNARLRGAPKLVLKRKNLQPGVVACACSSSYSGVEGRRMA